MDSLPDRSPIHAPPPWRPRRLRRHLVNIRFQAELVSPFLFQKSVGAEHCVVAVRDVTADQRLRPLKTTQSTSFVAPPKDSPIHRCESASSHSRPNGPQLLPKSVMSSSALERGETIVQTIVGQSLQRVGDESDVI